MLWHFLYSHLSSSWCECLEYFKRNFLLKCSFVVWLKQNRCDKQLFVFKAENTPIQWFARTVKCHFSQKLVQELKLWIVSTAISTSCNAFKSMTNSRKIPESFVITFLLFLELSPPNVLYIVGTNLVFLSKKSKNYKLGLFKKKFWLQGHFITQNYLKTIYFSLNQTFVCEFF